MPFTLGPRARAAGYRLHGFESVGSTNSLAVDAAREGDPGRAWFAALRQTAGRGRRGRLWETEAGNLAASLLLIFETEGSDIAGLGFVAGVALGAALRTALPDLDLRIGLDGADGREKGAPARIALKWPNDVLLDGAKLAGILLEAQKLPGGAQAVVIGIGVNVVSAPADLPYPATSITAQGGGVDAAALLVALSDHWVSVYDLWRGGRGLPEVLALWREYAAGIGAPVAVTTANGIERGIFDDIDDSGRLLIRKPDGTKIMVSAGDVHFGVTAGHTI